MSQGCLSCSLGCMDMLSKVTHFVPMKYLTHTIHQDTELGRAKSYLAAVQGHSYQDHTGP